MHPDSVGRILAAGGHVRINTLHPDTLVQLASIARQHQSRLEIVGSLHPDSLVRIAAAGGGFVTFDLTD
jgi:hypothetical protein